MAANPGRFAHKCKRPNTTWDNNKKRCVKTQGTYKPPSKAPPKFHEKPAPKPAHYGYNDFGLPPLRGMTAQQAIAGGHVQWAHAPKKYRIGKKKI